jgi:hypothetical protein
LHAESIAAAEKSATPGSCVVLSFFFIAGCPRVRKEEKKTPDECPRSFPACARGARGDDSALPGYIMS